MSIKLTSPILYAGAHVPVDGATLSYDADLEADLVNRNMAVYVINPAQGGLVPVMASKNFTGGSDFSGNNSTLKLPAGETNLTGGVGGAGLPLTNTDTGFYTFRAQTDLINAQDVDATTGNFRITGGGSGTAFPDWNSDYIPDKIYRLGVNPGFGDGSFRENTTQPSLCLTWETKYWTAGQENVYAQEFGLRGNTDTGVERRIFDGYFPYHGLDYALGFNVQRFGFGHPISKTGSLNGYDRISYGFWPRNAIEYKGIAITGTASGATTDGAVYAIGSTTINLAAAGTGSLLQDTVIQFAGDTNYYAVQTAVANVSSGGALVIHPPLVAQITAGKKAITRVSVPPPSTFIESNNLPFCLQQDNLGTYRKNWYINNVGSWVLADAPIGPLTAGSSVTIKQLPTMTVPVLVIQDSSGNTITSIGGNDTGTGVSAGWMRNTAKYATNATAGYESHYNNGTKNVTLQTSVDGSSSAVALFRMLVGGTWSGTTTMRFDVPDAAGEFVWKTQSGSVDRFKIKGTHAEFKMPAQLASYADVASLPSAVTVGAGALCRVAASTTPGGAAILVSDGSVWKIMLALGSATTVA